MTEKQKRQREEQEREREQSRRDLLKLNAAMREDAIGQGDYPVDSLAKLVQRAIESAAASRSA